MASVMDVDLDVSIQPDVPTKQGEPELGEDCKEKATPNSSSEDRGEDTAPEQIEVCGKKRLFNVIDPTYQDRPLSISC